MELKNQSEEYYKKKYPDLSADDDLVVEESPHLSKEQQRILNPVVVSSRDKIMCVGNSVSGCNTLIYPPSKFCGQCSMVLQEASAQKMRESRTWEI